jgi:hypothetical protein
MHDYFLMLNALSSVRAGAEVATRLLPNDAVLILDCITLKAMLTFHNLFTVRNIGTFNESTARGDSLL